MASDNDVLTAAEALALTPLRDAVFEGVPCLPDYRRTFGGLLAGRALWAAAATADGAPCHALHLLFLRGGVPDTPTRFEVERLRDGRSFKARQVRALQNGRSAIHAMASFHSGDDGPRHSISMPDAPCPDLIEDQLETRRRSDLMSGRKPRTYMVDRLLDVRPDHVIVDRENGVQARRGVWFRARAPIGDDPVLHQALIAFGSDYGLVHLGLSPHEGSYAPNQIDGASLDHAIWFHRATRADEWLYIAQQTTLAADGRGMTHGAIFDSDGRLVASLAQEVMIRVRKA